jgi:hypothetical protein
MKTLNLLTLAAATLTAIALNVSANDALLSPRAKGMQTNIVPAVATDPNIATSSQNLAVAPRALDRQGKVAATVETRNLAVGACAVGSPRQIERLAKTASASCCAIGTTACNSPKSCCAAN